MEQERTDADSDLEDGAQESLLAPLIPDRRTLGKDILVSISGNRVLLLCILGQSWCTQAFITPTGNITEGILISSAMTAAALVESWVAGTGTRDTYKRTDEHITKHGTLDERYFVNAIQHVGEIFGYCDLQGMYLAAKKHGLVELFREYERKHPTPCIIPIL